MVIVNGQLDTLLSILDPQSSQEEQDQTLLPKEVEKFIEYILERTELMSSELTKFSKSTNEAMMIHHIERIKEFFNRTLGLLGQCKRQLAYPDQSR